MTKNTRLQQLIDRYIDKSLSKEEKTELLDYFDDPTFLAEIEERLGMEYEREPGNYEMDEADQQKLLKHIFCDKDPVQWQAGRKIKLWPRIGIAAAVAIIAVSFGVWFFKSGNEGVNIDQVVYVNDVSPGKQGATLTLANGQRILIGDALTGNITNQSGVKISKGADGQIIYELTETKSRALEYNTLSTTRGEHTQVRLPDGSVVFLNAASSLKYPTSFAKQEVRRVSLTGEGYFEIARDETHPFIVNTAQQEVKVLGTHFNVNSYTDEKDTRTTLLEGSVRLNGKTVLKPGDQAALSRSGVISVNKVNADDVIAWTNGKFIFDGESIESIMRKLSRWYDVEVTYEGSVKDRQFAGTLSRRDNISKILDKITFTQAAHFKIEGRRIIVMP